MLSGNSTVSIIVPTRNSARTLEACLTSIRSQSYRPIELIVVDNESADQTMEIATKYADNVVMFGPERSAQRNRGAQLARGEYLVFIDSDMTLMPQVIAECMHLVGRTGARGVVIPEISVGEGFLARCRAFERSCYAGDATVEAARFFDRSAFEASGGFDESLTGPEDWDLSIRVAAAERFPRVDTYISHDEGHLRLVTALAKKRYYAASSMRYWRKHGQVTVGQANLVVRPAFIRNWRRFVAHPVLGAGVLSLKTLEAGAVTVGLVDLWLGGRKPQATRPESE